MIGKIYGEGKMFLRNHVADAVAEDGKEYELSLSGANPMVRSIYSGNTFVLDWESIIKIAIENGINKEIKENETI